MILKIFTYSFWIRKQVEDSSMYYRLRALQMNETAAGFEVDWKIAVREHRLEDAKYYREMYEMYRKKANWHILHAADKCYYEGLDYES